MNLQARNESAIDMKRIILIGYMGAGKTTIGRVLARRLNLDFFDLDWYIEDRFHKKVADIFAESGEEGFRKIERNMLHEAAEFENIVLSCGGGTPCFFDNMEYMNQLGETLYLKASPETLYAHLKMGKGVRPLLLNKTPEEVQVFIREQLKQREPFYDKAKHIIDINVMDNLDKVEQTVKEVRQLLNV